MRCAFRRAFCPGLFTSDTRLFRCPSVLVKRRTLGTSAALVWICSGRPLSATEKRGLVCYTRRHLRTISHRVREFRVFCSKALTKRIGRLGFALVLVFSLPAFLLDAQDESQAPQTAPMGEPRVSFAHPVACPFPARIFAWSKPARGRAWVSWTDENGHFDLPGLPLGHYRIEVSQLGFDNATQEFDLGEDSGHDSSDAEGCFACGDRGCGDSGPKSKPNCLQAAGTPPNSATNANAGARADATLRRRQPQSQGQVRAAAGRRIAPQAISGRWRRARRHRQKARMARQRRAALRRAPEVRGRADKAWAGGAAVSSR